MADTTTGSGEPPKGGVVPADKGAAAAKGKGGKKDDAAGAEGVVGGALMTVVVRNEFYRDGFRSLLKIAIVEAAIIVTLIITFIAYIDTVKGQDHYFATTADGRIMQVVPLEYGNMNDAALLSWASQAASEVMTFGYHDYQRRLQYSARHFTRHGWETFTDALQKSRIIESIQALQQVVSAEPRSAPIPLQETVSNGKHRWVVKVPLKVTYEAGTGSRIDNIDVTMVIDRVPSLENTDGVGIEQWISTQPGEKANN